MPTKRPKASELADMQIIWTRPARLLIYFEMKGCIRQCRLNQDDITAGARHKVASATAENARFAKTNDQFQFVASNLGLYHKILTLQLHYAAK